MVVVFADVREPRQAGVLMTGGLVVAMVGDPVAPGRVGAVSWARPGARFRCWCSWPGDIAEGGVRASGVVSGVALLRVRFAASRVGDLLGVQAPGVDVPEQGLDLGPTGRCAPCGPTRARRWTARARGRPVSGSDPPRPRRRPTGMGA